MINERGIDDSFHKSELIFLYIFLNRSFDLKRFVILTFGRIYDSLELAFRFNTVGA